MRVLLTGIDGFVGSHFAEYLAHNTDAEIHGTILDNSLARNIEHLGANLHLHPANILDPVVINEIFQKVQPDRVVHLAGQAFVPASLKDPIGTFEANIFGGISILEASRKLSSSGSGPSVLVVSTGEVYGRVDAESIPIHEDVPIAPRNPYAASKASLDLISQQYNHTFGVDVTVVRPLNHAGPRQSPAFVCSDFAKQIAEIAVGKRDPIMHVGNINVKRDFTDVRDVVRAYWGLFNKTSDEIVFNVCSGHGIEIKEILDILQEISGVSVSVTSDADRVRAYDVPIIIGSYDRLHTATGWTPKIPFRQTLHDVYEYWHHEIAAP